MAQTPQRLQDSMMPMPMSGQPLDYLKPNENADISGPAATDLQGYAFPSPAALLASSIPVISSSRTNALNVSPPSGSSRDASTQIRQGTSGTIMTLATPIPVSSVVSSQHCRPCSGSSTSDATAAAMTPAGANDDQGIFSSSNIDHARTSSTMDCLTFKPIAVSSSRDSLLQQRFDPDYIWRNSDRLSRAGQCVIGSGKTVVTVEDVLKHLPTTPLAICDGHGVMSTVEPFNPDASSFGTAMQDSSEAEEGEEVCTKTAFDDGELLIESPRMINKQIKRAVSEESFLRRENALFRMASLRSKGVGLEDAYMTSPPCCLSQYATPPSVALNQTSGALWCSGWEDSQIEQQQQQQHAQSGQDRDTGLEGNGLKILKGKFAPAILRSKKESSIRRSNESQRSQHSQQLFFGN
ncbi:hypothetical protein BGX28_006384 [Mortierella sp. GBA30]|nr:hypothetical protein BGX28_006384 [Mortierella sp. GBA30]